MSQTRDPRWGIMGEAQCSVVGVLGAWPLSCCGPIILLSRPYLPVCVCVTVTSQVTMLLEKGSGLEVKFPVLPRNGRVTYPCQSFEASEQPVSSAAGGGSGGGGKAHLQGLCDQ